MSEFTDSLELLSSRARTQTAGTPIDGRSAPFPIDGLAEASFSAVLASRWSFFRGIVGGMLLLLPPVVRGYQVSLERGRVQGRLTGGPRSSRINF